SRLAVVRQEGSQYWVARPRAIPEPPLESLEQAKYRAECYALAALPPPLPIRQPTGPHPLSRGKAACLWPGEGFVTDWKPSPKATDCPDIPDFLRRAAHEAPETEKSAHVGRACR